MNFLFQQILIKLKIYRHPCGKCGIFDMVNPAYMLSLRDIQYDFYKKKEIALSNNLSFWVGEGDRTLDPQDHNLIL